jgi:8-oxo-dGTP pyrophosphatase MutT (NUDIX family)
MGLGRRNARQHETVGFQKNAMDSTVFWEFKPQQQVMTVDGVPGVVTAVLDGPYPGTEAYEVTLDNGLGGGSYTASQLQPLAGTTASHDHEATGLHLASDDYPEMGSILHDRPPIERMTFSAARGDTPFEFRHVETDTGGTKFPTRVDLTAHHPETGEEVGSARYFPPKRRGGPVSIDEVRTTAPGAGSALLNEIESRHPGSTTKFLHEVKRNNNNPDVTGHAHERAGNPSDWDTHYPNVADTIHRGIALKLPSYSARVVNSPGNSKEDHLAEIHSAMPEGPNVGTHWTEDEHAARLFAHNAVSDYRTTIPVVLHAAKPERKDIETRQTQLYRGGVFPYGDPHSSENEIPVRRGRGVKVTGISWKPDAPHPDADEHGWIHHTYPEPKQHTAAMEDLTDEDEQEAEPELPPCAYCGSDQMEIAGDTGRAQQARCQVCGGMMSAPYGLQFKPELIGDPSNHPKDDPDPASGGVPGAANMRVPVKRMNDSDYTASLHTARTVSWDEIGSMHPHVYGDAEIHGEDAEGADGPGIGDAANYLAHERPGHQDAEDHSVHDLSFRPMRVHPRHIDFNPSGPNDQRVRNARQGYQEHPDQVPPLVLVKRHNVYQVADGHHRAEAAASLNKSVRAYVADSPYPDEPFADGQKGPFYNAVPLPKEVQDEHNLHGHMQNEHGYSEEQLAGKSDKDLARFHDQKHFDCPAEFHAKMGRLHTAYGYVGGVLFRTASDDEQDTSYRMQHQAPDADYGAPLHDVEKMMPGFYDHPEWYNHGQEHLHESVPVIRGARGNPEKKVRIYRALPAEHAGKGFNTGDWVSTSKSYARDHAKINADSKHDWPVISTVVPAKHLHTEGDVHEWAYNGPHQPDANVAFKGGYHQEVRQRADGSIGPVQRKANPFKDRANELKEKGYSFSHYKPSQGSPEHTVVAWDPDENWAGQVKAHENGEVHHVEIEPEHAHEPLEEHMRDMIAREVKKKTSSLVIEATLHEALQDNEFAFHFTASWSDVRAKAKRIRSEGKVNITVATHEGVGGEVKGDHHVYETLLTYVPGTSKVGAWECGCKWAAFAWGRSPAYRRFEGRMCSHALAMQFEAQARGMFGRTVEPNSERPKWLRHHTPVVTQYERDSGENLTRRAVPPGNMRRTYEGAHPQVYLRFGAWPKDERSHNNVTGFKEEGVSVYDLDHHGDPKDPDEHMGRWHEHDESCGPECDLDSYNEDYGNDTGEEMRGRVHRAERNRYNGTDRPSETGHLVTGDEVGVGHDGEPLLNNVKRVGDWIDHRHLFIPSAKPHSLARGPYDDGYEPPKKMSGRTAAEEPINHVELQKMWDKIRDEEHAKHQDDATYAENYEPLHKSDLHPDEHSAWRFERNTDVHPTILEQFGIHQPEFDAPRHTDASHGPVPLTQYKHPSGREPLHLDSEGNSWRRHYEWETPESRYPKFRGWSGPHSASETIDTHPTWSTSGGDGDQPMKQHMRTMRERMNMQGVLPGENYDELTRRKMKTLRDSGWGVVSSLDVEGVYDENHSLDLVHPPVYAQLVEQLPEVGPVEAMNWMVALGMTHAAARAVVKDVSAELATGQFHFDASLRLLAEEGEHEEHEKKRCPDCGSMISEKDEKCPHCHHVFMKHHHGAKTPAEGDLMSRGMVIGGDWDHDAVHRMMNGQATAHDLLRHVDKEDVGDFWYAHDPHLSREQNLYGAKDFARTESSEHPAEDLDRDHPIGEVGMVLVGHKPAGWDPGSNPDHGLMGNSYIPHSADVPLHEIHYQDHKGGWHSTDANGHSVHVTGGGYDEPASHVAAKADRPTVAGVALKAADTGRVLMLQRGLHDEDDPAAGTWEFPGGHEEDGDQTSLHTGIREWEEETGHPFPDGGVVHHTWTSPNGIYQGHLVVIPEESAVQFQHGRQMVNPDNPDGDQHEQAAWWDPDHARKNPALREELKTGTPWKEIKAAGNAKTAATADPLYGLEESSPITPPPHSTSTNPASSGWATTQDPHSWDDPEDNATNFGALPSDGYLGSLHDQPEPALPSTDGAESEIDDEREDADPSQYDENDAELTPNVTTNTTVGSLGDSTEDIVARFQATAGARALGGGGGDNNGGHHAAQQANNKEIANAAKQFLTKSALKDFNFAEQQELINEGARNKTMARNSDVLNIEGTHYSALEAALAAEDALEDSADLFA